MTFGYKLAATFTVVKQLQAYHGHANDKGAVRLQLLNVD